MCICCCPPAITALFYLWVRSGFSKGSVAGALTFFPPDPPLYKFKRIGKNGEELPDEPADDSEGSQCEDMSEDGENREIDEDDESDLGTFEIDTRSAREKKQPDSKQPGDGDDEKKKRKNRREQQQRRQEEEEEDMDPIAQMTARSKRLRQRAKSRARRDAIDAANGVTFRFEPDLANLGPLPSFNGTITAVKIGPQKRTGTYVAALLYKLQDSECTPQTKTILYSHGNATDIGAMSGLQCIISKNVKCHVLVYDYSGYGESGGIPMEKNTYRDVKLVYEWVVGNITRPQLEGKAEGTSPESNIILYGQSVGSGPSCYLASRRADVGGLVLHSPFTSGMRVLTPSRALACLDIFPNIDRIKKVRCPVFIIHGQRDQEVGFEHGLALQAAVPEDCKRDPWWVPDKGHNDITDGPGIVDYIQRLNGFVRSLEG